MFLFQYPPSLGEFGANCIGTATATCALWRTQRSWQVRRWHRHDTAVLEAVLVFAMAVAFYAPE